MPTRDPQGRFLPGNQCSRKTHMDGAELAAFRQAVMAFLGRWGWDPGDLDEALDYARRGGYTTKILKGRRAPSTQYRRRFAELLEVESDPAWRASQAGPAGAIAVPVARIEGEPRQCVECLAQMTEGRRREPDTWWWFAHPSTRVCTAHRRAWRRRCNWFRRCLVLGCPHVEVVDGMRPPAYTCRQEDCSLRRWPWRQSWQ